MSLVGCQINPIDVNFQLQKVWKVWTKNQLKKSYPRMTRSITPSCQLGLTWTYPIWARQYFFSESHLFLSSLRAHWDKIFIKSWTPIDFEASNILWLEAHFLIKFLRNYSPFFVLFSWDVWIRFFLENDQLSKKNPPFFHRFVNGLKLLKHPMRKFLGYLRSKEILESFLFCV